MQTPPFTTVYQTTLCSSVAQAALQGKSLGRFLEDAIEQALSKTTGEDMTWAGWAANLPQLSKQAVEDLEKALAEPGFRAVEPEMWE